MLKSFCRRLGLFLSSVRLAVVCMATLAVVCAFATFYEAAKGTPAAQRDVYKTAWFASLLALLGANVLAAMLNRFPWTRHHVGFLTAHVGLLAILLGSVVSLYGGLDSQMAIVEGETSDRVTLPEQALQLSVPARGVQASLPLAFDGHPPAAGCERRFRVPGTEMTVVVDGYEAHVRVVDSYEPLAGGSAALHLVVQAPMAAHADWLAAEGPASAQLDLGVVSFGLTAASSEADALRLLRQTGTAGHLSFVSGPGPMLRFATRWSGGRRHAGAVLPGEPIATGWPGLAVTVDRFIPAAAAVRSVTPLRPPAKDENRQPAVRVRIEDRSERSDPQWIPWGERGVLSVGGRFASVGYSAPQKHLPFRVSLLRFNHESYPGSPMASTYESTVRIDDPEQGSLERLISMNHPLHHRGYVFFQSSFVDGRPATSVFSVARAPGLPLVYFGATLVALGIAWLFYVKPYLARRQAARVLARRRARESLA